MQRARIGSALALAAAGATLACTLPAQAADDVVRACAEAHAQGQIQRSDGQLLAARRQFLACSQPSCPLLVRKECVAFGEQVSVETPSIVIFATDSQGGDVTLASVIVDASWSLSRDFGMALELDPGSHEIVLRSRDGRTARSTFLLRAGERLRRVVVEFPEPVSSEPKPRSALPYVIGGLGLAALGSFIGFAVDGKLQERELEECRPHCTREGVDRMRRSYLIADVSLAVAVAAAGIEAYLILKAPDAAQGGLTVSAVGRF